MTEVPIILETSPLICGANQWTIFYMIEIFVKKELMQLIDVINPFQPSVAFHIKTSHFFWTAKEITGFYMKWTTGLKSFNQEISNYFETISYFVKPRNI